MNIGILVSRADMTTSCRRAAHASTGLTPSLIHGSRYCTSFQPSPVHRDVEKLDRTTFNQLGYITQHMTPPHKVASNVVTSFDNRSIPLTRSTPLTRVPIITHCSLSLLTVPFRQMGHLPSSNQHVSSGTAIVALTYCSSPRLADATA